MAQSLADLVSGLRPDRTLLTNDEERRYQQWVRHYQLKDVDPATGENWDDVHYDTRGYWKANQGPPRVAGSGPPHFAEEHGPDTYKQHGHPTFSQESQYSRGPSEGGMWVGETFVPQPKMAVSHRRAR